MSNRLTRSQSLYLRKHALNPIDWWSWCDEALEAAKAQNKPIFLSIGYSSCHWCTVMEGEAFSDEAIAEFMNANFLPIKVDREERPDIDSIYMQALQMMTGQGGWPLNIFLTPEDLVPFYGGTYFPITPRYNRPGFLQVLQSVRRFYDVETEKLQQFKAEILSSLQRSIDLSSSQTDLLSERLLRQGIETSTQIVGAAEFGRPSFPMMPYSNLVLQGSRLGLRSPYGDVKQVAVQRGNDLSLGGIYDHVAGGFHRYTVDATWTVPHFEKMLYDNGQIIEYLANLWSAGVQEPAYERAILGTVEWLQREMTAPENYFYAAQDADSFTNPEITEPEEGAFYVWGYREVDSLLTDLELKGLQSAFTITPEGNFEGKNVLQRKERAKLTKKQENALSKLFKARYGEGREQVPSFPPARNNEEAKTGDWKGRIPPVTDTKMIVGWNALMISGLAKASVALDQRPWVKLAEKVAKFILENQWVGDRLHRLNYGREVAVLAQSEDYAFLIKALLDLHQASLAHGRAAAKWLNQAVRVQQEFDTLLWSENTGGYYSTVMDINHPLLVQERSYIDNATPSANGVAIANLVRLALLTNEIEYLDRAEAGLQAFSSFMQQSPQACPSLFTALDWYCHATLVRTTEEQLQDLTPYYFPSTVYHRVTDLPETSVGMVCRGLSCLEPARSLEELLEQLQRISTSSKIAGRQRK